MGQPNVTAAALKAFTLSNSSTHPPTLQSTLHSPTRIQIYSNPQAFTLRHLRLWAVPEPPEYTEGHFLSYRLGLGFGLGFGLG